MRGDGDGQSKAVRVGVDGEWGWGVVDCGGVGVCGVVEYYIDMLSYNTCFCP